jgi:hypothetical protein
MIITELAWPGPSLSRALINETITQQEPKTSVTVALKAVIAADLQTSEKLTEGKLII